MGLKYSGKLSDRRGLPGAAYLSVTASVQQLVSGSVGEQAGCWSSIDGTCIVCADHGISEIV